MKKSASILATVQKQYATSASPLAEGESIWACCATGRRQQNWLPW